MVNRYQNYRVLVVDDNANICQIYGVILRAFGLRDIQSAQNAQEAWSLLATHRPDLVLLDLNMTDMNGLALAKRIRTASDSPDPFVPIIVVTAYSGRTQVLDARAMGVNEFVSKPFAPADLLKRVTLALEEPRPFVRTPTFFGPCRRRGVVGGDPGQERRGSAKEADPATVP